MKKIIGAALTVLLAASLLVGIAPATQAQAANAALFDPGNLISDAVFFNGDSMTAGSVQEFLDRKVPNCASSYVCLKSYTQDTPNRAAVPGRCDAYAGRAGERAASIIARVGIACDISQQAMIVLLEKEQGLVSDSTPGARQYRSATGYGCPDTADCDTSYYGFFNQVYAAALQFQYYAANPTRWKHVPGRVNAVLFHPNAACGSSSVFIQNQATAGLYNYTPYQPNPAALANLYGSGDACSSYGNRNFFRIFSDWFGDPQTGSSLVRTASDPTVYLISGDEKHALRNQNTLNALYPLGGIAYVSDSYLRNFTTGAVLGRVIRSNAGKVYFFDVGAKLQFMTCSDVSSYGVACGDSILLTDKQINSLRDGPVMSRVFITTEGKRFLIEGGVKREVLDDISLAAVEHPTNVVTLFEAAIEYLPWGTPVVRDGIAVRASATGAFGLMAGSRFVATKTTLYDQSPLGAAFPEAALDSRSVSQLPVAPALTGYMRESGGRLSVLTSGGRIIVREVEYSGITFTDAPAGVLAKLPVVSTTTGPHFVKEINSSALYLVKAGKKQRLTSWAPYEQSVKEGVPAAIWTVPDDMLATVPAGADLTGTLVSGQLVKSASSPRVYLVDGSRLLALSTFGISMGLGFGAAYKTLDDSTINAYDRSQWIDSLAVKCGADFYVGIGGQSAAIYDPALVSALGLDHLVLSAQTCSVMPKASKPLTYFLRGVNGKIYWLNAGTKRPINSWAELDRLGGVDKWVQVSDELLSELPTGAPTAP